MSLEKIDFDWELGILSQDTVIEQFESEDQDLNDFLLNDAKNYSKSLLAVTYIVKTKGETIAYFCLLHDCLTKDDEEQSVWNRVNRAIANEKRRRNYPAVKIGRLAVSKKYAGLGFGKFIIETVIKMYISSQQQAGCRFVTVDATVQHYLFTKKTISDTLQTKTKTKKQEQCILI